MYCPHCGVSNPDGSTICRVCGKEVAARPSSASCPHCGADVQAGLAICAKCGMSLSSQPAPEPVATVSPRVVEPTAAAPTTEPTYEAEVSLEPTLDESDAFRGKWCPQCGRPKSVYADLCDHCLEAEEKSLEVSHHGSERSPVSDISLAGGLLILISGILGLVYGFVSVADVANTNLPMGITCFTSLMIVFGLIAIVGGVSGMMRKNALHAILAGVFGILSIGFFIGALAGLVGLLLVYLTRDEFDESELTLDLLK